MLRNLQALRDVDLLKTSAESLEERTKRLEESNKRDPLTNLFNRAYLDHYLKDAFLISNKSDTPLSIAFADLDKFKSVNDTYGHAMGDQILVTTANILKANVRGADVVARYGGEEFILVFPHTEYPLLKTICERIVRAFRETRHDVGTKRDLERDDLDRHGHAQRRPAVQERRGAAEGRRQGALYREATRAQSQRAVRPRREQPTRLHVAAPLLLRQSVAGANDEPAIAARRLEQRPIRLHGHGRADGLQKLEIVLRVAVRARFLDVAPISAANCAAISSLVAPNGCASGGPAR